MLIKNKVCIHYFETNIKGVNLETKQRQCVHLFIDGIKDRGVRKEWKIQQSLNKEGMKGTERENERGRQNP